MDCYWYRRLGGIISQWTSSSLFIRRGDNVFSLCIKWASLAFLTASRLLRRSSSGIRMTSLIKCPASLAHLQGCQQVPSHPNDTVSHNPLDWFVQGACVQNQFPLKELLLHNLCLCVAVCDKRNSSVIPQWYRRQIQLLFLTWTDSIKMVLNSENVFTADLFEQSYGDDYKMSK